MKKLIFLASFLFATTVFAQYSYDWDRYSLHFESPVKLDIYETESIEVFGSDNNDYAVDISGFTINENNRYPQSISVKQYAYNIASLFGFTETKDGGPLPNIKKGYYVITKSSLSDATVILVVAWDEKRNHYIEGTVYCYNFNEEVGVKIAKTFQFKN